MKNIKILGSGCSNCDTTYKLINDIGQSKGVALEIEKIEDMAKILSYGVMSTPGVVIDDKVVHMGSVPSKSSVEKWLSE